VGGDNDKKANAPKNTTDMRITIFLNPFMQSSPFVIWLKAVYTGYHVLGLITTTFYEKNLSNFSRKMLWSFAWA